ncbi:molybdopterin molybdotransferase MoeA [Sulfurimonas sp. HSL3-7]|uniref:molybdopterin molybdotransferase MoeA n=1 Tax=Sulfonitrofixus jiaomeiensis TaxID=3131938 RepID=UPI0031F90DFC
MSFLAYEASVERLNALDTGAVRSEKVFLNASLGRYLAEDLVAFENSPTQPTSAMDGYAVLHSDLASGRIKILGDNPAGSDETREVTSGYCIKTFTGSVMPRGADTLIPIENVTVEGDTIIVNKEVSCGFSVRPIGESYAKDDVLINKGTKIGFAEIGVMAGLNTAVVPVVLKPRVAVLSTGSEILEIGEPQQNAAQIRSSNHHTIAAIANMAGGEAMQMGVVKDDRASITAAFENALSSADIVVSTGGVSVGDYDFVKDIIPALGAEVVFKGVNIKPGQHVMVAQKGEKLIIGLPGFAYSSTVTFLLYVVPLIKKFLGSEKVFEVVEATLAEPFNKRSKKSEFTACNLRFENGRYVVDFEGKKSGTSAILTNMLGSSALIHSKENDGAKEAGETVKVIKLDRF